MILRGGKRPNYDAESVDIAAEELERAGLQPRIMIDFSHANSRKKHEKQVDVARDVSGQIGRGDIRIMGAMIESHLIAGRQEWQQGDELTYGQSITDACIGWPESVPVLQLLAEAVRTRREAMREP